jgi:hypothetical protein
MSKQFNIKGINGLYLSYKPQIDLTTLNYKNQLIEDYDFFPTNTSEANLFDFKNAKYQDSNKIIGSNATQKSNSVYKYSEMSSKEALVANKMYYNTFKFYFRFFGSTMSNYKLSGLTAAQTKRILDRLRVEVHVVIGSNTIPMELSNLEKYSGGSWTAVTTSDTAGAYSSIANGDYGIELSSDFVTGLGSVDAIHMAYTGTTQMNTLFNGYTSAPDGYNFRVDASFPDFAQIANNNKNYKIIVRYYNIGVTGTGTYATTRAVELMANNYVYYEEAVSPTSNPVV